MCTIYSLLKSTCHSFHFSLLCCSFYQELNLQFVFQTSLSAVCKQLWKVICTWSKILYEYKKMWQINIHSCIVVGCGYRTDRGSCERQRCHTTAVSPMACHMYLKIPSQCNQANVVCLITLQNFLHTSSHFIKHNGSQGIQHYINPYHIYPNRRQGLFLQEIATEK